MTPSSTSSGKQSRVSLAAVVSHPIQYYVPLYRELSAREDVDLTVLFYTDIGARPYEDPGFGRVIAWDVPLFDGYRSKVLSRATRSTLPPSGRDDTRFRGLMEMPNLALPQDIAKERYQGVWLSAYSSVNDWLAGAAAKALKRRLLVRVEGALEQPRPRFRRVVKYPPLRWLFADAVGLFSGERNRRYLKHYGIRDERLYFAPYCVDNAFFRGEATRLAGQREAIRRELGIDTDDPVILVCGKLIAGKRPLEIIRAFSRLRAHTKAWLLLVGDGPLRADAERLTAQLGVKGVVFAGFQNQSEISRSYVAADVLLLFSRQETWGLVANEAMNFSLPLVLADTVGCCEDLVHEGRNGYIVHSEDWNGLVAVLARLITNLEVLRSFGDYSSSLVKRYSVEACAEGIVRAAQDARRD